MAHVLRAWVIEDGISAWHIMCEQKSNELGALPQLIAALDLSGATVTIDAMAGHPHIVEQIHAGGGHCVQALKANEKEAFETVQTQFQSINASLQPTGISGAPASSTLVSSGLQFSLSLGMGFGGLGAPSVAGLHLAEDLGLAVLAAWQVVGQ